LTSADNRVECTGGTIQIVQMSTASEK